MRKFVCDVCGVELEHHGERYIVHIEAVPAYRTAGNSTWDLCPECAAKLRASFEKEDECDR